MRPAVAYSPDVETARPDEAEVIAGLNAALREIMETTSRDYGHAVRAVHAKSHGLIAAELEVLPNLPPELAQGLFATVATHPAVLRLSTNAGDILPDRVSLPRGMALKVLDVPGERLPGADGATQDFVLVNAPVFTARDPKAFLRNLRLLAKTTDRAEGAKEVLSAALRGAERALETVGLESGLLKTLGGARNLHPLGETFWSQTPFRYGAHIAKFQIRPVSEVLIRHAGEEIDASKDDDAVRHAVDASMREGVAEWEFRVQLCRDLEAMPVEDPTVPWDEAASPFAAVAILRARPQPGWSEARARVVDDAMRFSVWTGIEAHRPLGAINRARGPAYAMSSAFRGRVNGCPMHEPDAVRWPD